MNQAVATIVFDRIGGQVLDDLDDIYLVAQTPDIDIHHIGFRVKVLAPHMLQDLGPRKHPVRGAHEEFQKTEFTGGQVDHFIAHFDHG